MLEILITIGAIAGMILVLMISSIVGVVRAMRRRRRGEHSRTAVALALIAALITTAWVLYWTGDNLYQHHNPVDGLLAINLAICALPFWWLIAAIRAQKSSVLQRREKEMRKTCLLMIASVALTVWPQMS